MKIHRFTKVRLFFFGTMWRIASKIQRAAGHVAAYGYHNECRVITEDTRMNRKCLNID